MESALELHSEWLSSQGKEGERFALIAANLTDTNLARADLTGAWGWDTVHGLEHAFGLEYAADVSEEVLEWVGGVRKKSKTTLTRSREKPGF